MRKTARTPKRRVVAGGALAGCTDERPFEYEWVADIASE